MKTIVLAAFGIALATSVWAKDYDQNSRYNHDNSGRYEQSGRDDQNSRFDHNRHHVSYRTSGHYRPSYKWNYRSEREERRATADLNRQYRNGSDR